MVFSRGNSEKTWELGYYTTGSSPVRTALNIDFQYFTKQAPNFTPENVKLGVCFEFEYFLVGMSFFCNVG